MSYGNEKYCQNEIDVTAGYQNDNRSTAGHGSLIFALPVEGEDMGRYSYEIYTERDGFFSTLRNLMSENHILKKVVKNLWTTRKYDHEYISFLLGKYTKEQFKTVARKYAITADEEVSASEIEYASRFLLNYLDEELSSSDFSVLLNTDCQTVENSLVSFGYKAVS